MWIYKHKDWPDFIWDSDTIAPRLAEISYSQGKLLGKMESLGFDLQQEAGLNTLAKDIVKSSSIEGESLNQEEVRSSIARRLGIEIAGLVPASRDVEGVVEMMLDATRSFSKKLTRDRLFAWHASLFPAGRSGMHRITVGDWRKEDSGPMQVVSGPIGREKVHFEAPHANKVAAEMGVFLNWFESDENSGSALKSAIAHLWFVTIHPFEDGNGRIARAIADMALARVDATPNRYYSLSSQIETERKEYYLQLEKQQRGTPDITEWLQWFLGCLGRAIENSDQTLARTIFKAQLWKKINQNKVNERQRKIINRMLEENFKGHMNTSKYAKMAKCSNDTALRDMQNLKASGILIQNSGGGRSTSYRLPEKEELAKE